MLNPIKSPPFPPTAEMKSNQVLLGFVVYSMTVGLAKKTLRTAISFSYASYDRVKFVKV
jgi:hypothetical protein